MRCYIHIVNKGNIKFLNKKDNPLGSYSHSEYRLHLKFALSESFFDLEETKRAV